MKHILYILIVMVALLNPMPITAQTGAIGGEPHPTCIQWWNNECKQGTQNCQYPKKCEVSISGGKSVGHCEKTICVGDTASGLNGQQQGLDKGLQALSGILQQLMGQLGQGGGGSGGGSAVPTTGTEAPVASTTGTLYQAVQNVTGTIATGANEAQNTVSDILSSVFGGGAVTVPAATQPTTNTSVTVTSVAVATTTAAATTTATTTAGIASTTTATTTGSNNTENTERTETRTTEAGVTFEAGVRDVSTNSEVAGFYGNTAATEGERTTLAGRLCTTRPWASGIIARIISPTFFDGLCNRFGYSTEPVVAAPQQNTVQQPVVSPQQGGVTVVAGSDAVGGPGISCAPAIVRPGTEVTLSFSCAPGEKVNGVSGFAIANNAVAETTVFPSQTTRYAIRCSDASVYQCTVQVVNPRLSIVAEPQEVQLGARTVIRWQSEDVQEDTCTVTGPSFSERGGYGAASTVPINDTSTFTYTCIGLDGATTTEVVSVDLAI